jgi:hypothetical protein
MTHAEMMEAKFHEVSRSFDGMDMDDVVRLLGSLLAAAAVNEPMNDRAEVLQTCIEVYRQTLALNADLVVPN